VEIQSLVAKVLTTAAAVVVVLAVLELELMQVAMLALVGLEFQIPFQEPQLIMAAVAEPQFMERMQTGLVLVV
jgi:hypothetical protein